MKLIDGWRQSWRLWSVRLSALGAFLTGLALAAPDTLMQAWAAMPADVQALLPESLARVVPTLLFVGTLVARLIPQKEKNGGTKA